MLVIPARNVVLGGNPVLGERPQEPLLFLFVQIHHKRDSETTGADLTPLVPAKISGKKLLF